MQQTDSGKLTNTYRYASKTCYLTVLRSWCWWCWWWWWWWWWWNSLTSSTARFWAAPHPPLPIAHNELITCCAGDTMQIKSHISMTRNNCQAVCAEEWTNSKNGRGLTREFPHIVHTELTVRTLAAEGIVRLEVPVAVLTLITAQSLYVKSAATLACRTVAAERTTDRRQQTAGLIAHASCQSNKHQRQSTLSRRQRRHRSTASTAISSFQGRHTRPKLVTTKKSTRSRMMPLPRHQI